MDGQIRGVGCVRCTETKKLEEEHSRLKRMYADLAMDNQLLRDLLSITTKVRRTTATSSNRCRNCPGNTQPTVFASSLPTCDAVVNYGAISAFTEFTSSSK